MSTRTTTSSRSAPASSAPGATPVAVIELGTTSIRMAIAQVKRPGKYTLLDSLQMAVALGKDSFTKGRIEPQTTEECVKVLRRFRQILAEYDTADDARITAVATSAVREAANRDQFLDRLFIATGINVRVIEQAEVNRFTYLAVRPVLEPEPFWKRSDTLVIEVGGGSTEALVFRRGKVATAHLYRLGALRLRETMEESRLPSARAYEILQSQVDQTVAQIVDSLVISRSPTVVALGADARFACSRLAPDWDRRHLCRLNVSALSKLTGEILRQSSDDIVRRHRIAYPDAETLGPALMVYTRLARALKLRSILVGEVTLRNGVLAEIATGGRWTEDFKKQMINSALALGVRYGVEPRHAQYVATMCRRLFRLLQPEHSLDPRYEMILTIAALVHETGLYISRSSHHKHSLYLIANSDLFGLGSEDVLLTALVARYHRRALPQPSHEHYAALDRGNRIKVQKMAAILRVADALDAGHMQRLTDLNMTLDANRLVITAARSGSLAIEQHRMEEKADMFEQVYGMQVVLQSG